MRMTSTPRVVAVWTEQEFERALVRPRLARIEPASHACLAPPPPERNPSYPRVTHFGEKTHSRTNCVLGREIAGLAVKLSVLGANAGAQAASGCSTR